MGHSWFLENSFGRFGVHLWKEEAGSRLEQTEAFGCDISPRTAQTTPRPMLEQSCLLTAVENEAEMVTALSAFIATSG